MGDTGGSTERGEAIAKGQLKGEARVEGDLCLQSTCTCITILLLVFFWCMCMCWCVQCPFL